MNVFWRETPLNEEESELYQLVLQAHDASAFRGNISGQAVVMAAVGSRDYYKAIAAGLMTLGEAHGPISETWLWLNEKDPTRIKQMWADYGKHVPGWGNSFVKDAPDPLWSQVDKHLELYFHAVWARMVNVTKNFHAAGKNIYPNPSAYTAAAAIALGLPASISAYLLVYGRLAAWTQLAWENLK